MVHVFLSKHRALQTVARLANRVGVDAKDPKFHRTALHWAAEVGTTQTEKSEAKQNILKHSFAGGPH